MRDQTVLVAHSYYLRHDPKQWRRMKPYPPLATLLAAAVLRRQGHEVRLFDAMLAEGVGQFRQALETVQPAVVAIVEDSFNFLTKMCTLATREAALAMVQAAASTGARVVVNGPDESDHPDLYLAAGADAVITSEVEAALPEVVEQWLRDPGTSLQRIPGLALPGTNGSPYEATPPRPALQNLDQLPHPAWDLVDAARYRAAWTAAHGRLSWNMVTSRGCPYHCNWCAKPIFGTRYAQRRPQNVVAELIHLRESVAPDHVWFADDIFGLTTRWIEAFGREVVTRRAQTPFTMQSRVNLMKPAAVTALAAAGAEEVWLGVESGSQRILEAMDKGSKIAQVRSATRTLREHGIRVGWFVQLGYVGETWDDILLTRDLIRSEQPQEIGVSVAYPLPGTAFYEKVRATLGTRANWRDSGELAMLFAGAYPTTFYREVRDLLHAEVESGPDGDGRWTELGRRAAEFDAQRRTNSMT